MTEWEECGEPLPTAPGCVSGIVAKAKGKGCKIVSAQCSTCFRVFTGRMMEACLAVSFAPHMPYLGAEPFRRCRECIKADRLPDDADALREQQRLRNFERGEVTISDEWAADSLIERLISSTPDERDAAMRRMRAMLKAADERAMKRWLDKQ